MIVRTNIVSISFNKILKQTRRRHIRVWRNVLTFSCSEPQTRQRTVVSSCSLLQNSVVFTDVKQIYSADAIVCEIKKFANRELAKTVSCEKLKRIGKIIHSQQTEDSQTPKRSIHLCTSKLLSSPLWRYLPLIFAPPCKTIDISLRVQRDALNFTHHLHMPHANSPWKCVGCPC